MIFIETTITVTPDGKATIELSSNIVPGVHKVLLIVEEKSIKTRPTMDYNSAWDEFEQLIDSSIIYGD